MTRKVHIYPPLPKGADKKGDGGIRRVVEGQVRHLPAHGWEVVKDPEQADVIACHIEIPHTFIRKYPGKPIVLHNHGLYWTEYEWETWHRKTNASIMRSVRVADVITAVSEWTAAALRRNTMRDVRVVYHGVDVDDWKPTLSRSYVLWNKTVANPICDPQPVADVAALMPDVRFLTTIGTETANVSVTGVVGHEQARRYVSEAAVYLATTRETFGVGTLEALAAGVPVVGWAWGGQTEIITHGVDGWLAQPGDVEGLAAGIRWALANRDSVSRAARATAERFPASRSAQQYAEIYDEVAALYDERAAAPRVSVIVPAYDLDRFLPATLDSVLAQTTDDWECVIVDDASPDRCGEIADEYAARDPRFRVIHNPENLYLAGARNAGIEAARGRYIFPLDADDQIAPGTLETLARELDRDRETHITYGGVLFTDEDGQTPTDYHVAGKTPGHSGWPMEFHLGNQLDGPGQLLPYASMFRREVWELTGGYRERCSTSEDCDFWLRTTSYGFIPRMVTNVDTLIYRNREDSMSRTVGWADGQHREWYPWIKQRSLLPPVSREGAEVQFPSFDLPQIAVVIPVGPDHARYVKDAIDSVDAQTFRGWECIVVNDTGESLPILPTWVRIIEPEGVNRFGGVAAARNAGVRAARALRFLPLDADDFLQPEALEILFDAHMERADRPVVYSDFWEDPRGEWEVWETPDADPAGLISHGLRYAVTCLVPVEYWNRVGGYDEELPAWEDWAFQLKLAAAGICTRRVAIPLFSYRKHTGFRRNENFAGFDEAKAAMMSKDFGMDGGELLACKSCPGGQQTTYSRGGSGLAAANGGVAPMKASDIGTGDAVLIKYVGDKMGTIPYEGPSGRRYYFAAGGQDAQKYVLPIDAEKFLQMRDFQRVDVPPPAEAPAEVPPAPVDTPVPPPAAGPALVPGSTPQAAQGASPGPAPAAPPSDPDVIPDGPQTAAVYTAAQLKKMKRSDLDELADNVGVANPWGLANKQAVIDAMQMRGAVETEPAAVA